MTKTEFKRQINKAEKELENLYISNWDGRRKYTTGVCDSLDTLTDTDSSTVHPVEHFAELFEPKRSRIAYWLGKLNAKNLPRRKLALRLFEQICLDSGIYKTWRAN